MEKDLEILNNELSELKRTLADFTEEAEKRINDLLSEMNQPTEKTCDEELQEIIDNAKSFAYYGNHDADELFDLFLSLIDTYGLDRSTIEELYMQTDEHDNKGSFYYLEIFENDPTELNLIKFLKRYCWEFDFSFTNQLNNVFNYKNAMSVISELESLGFRKCQLNLIYKKDVYTDSRRLSEEFCYSNLLMITEVTQEQLNILKNKEEIYEILFPVREITTRFISI